MWRLPARLARRGLSTTPTKDIAASLADAEWWRAFYERKAARQGDRPFDWFDVDDERALSLVAKHCNRPSSAPLRVLHLGCGTSAWCERLDELASGAVTHLDASELAVATVRERLADPSRVVLGDARRLPAAWTASFDVVVDKGTLDVFLFGAPAEARGVCDEIARVLRGDGRYIMITGDTVDMRRDALDRIATPAQSWAIEFTHNVSANIDDSGGAFESWLFVARCHRQR